MAVIEDYVHQELFIIEALTVSGSASLKIFDANAPAAFKVLDMWVVGEPGGSGDTVKLTDGTDDIVAAMTVTTSDLIVRAADIDQAKVQIAANGTLELVTASAATARCFILCRRTN